MGTISDAASGWITRVKNESSARTAEQSAQNSLRNRSTADWPALRTKIVDAIAVVMAEVNAVTVGSGQLSMTVGSFPLDSGSIEKFQINVRCTDPQMSALVSVAAYNDYTVRCGTIGNTKTFGFADMLADGIEAAVRNAVIGAMIGSPLR